MIVFPTQPTTLICWSSRVKSLRISFNLAWCFSGISDRGRMPSGVQGSGKPLIWGWGVRNKTKPMQNHRTGGILRARADKSDSISLSRERNFCWCCSSGSVMETDTRENQAQGERMYSSVVVGSLSPHVVDLAVLEVCLEAELSQEEGVVGKWYLLYSGQGGKPEWEQHREIETHREIKRQRKRETHCLQLNPNSCNSTASLFPFSGEFIRG